MSARTTRLYARIAWRNLGRNRRRTALTAAAIVLGVALCIAMDGLNDGLSADLVASVTRADLGDAQVHRPGYLERRAIDRSLPHGVEVARAVMRTPGVEAAAARAYAWGFATHAGRTVGVQLAGVEPKQEVKVTRLASEIRRGAMLSETPTPWPAARALTAEQRALDARLTDQARDEAIAEIDALGAGPDGDAGAPSAQPAERPDDDAARAQARGLLRQESPPPSAPLPVLVGDALAARLHVDVGDPLSVLGQDTRGASIEVDARVAGILHAGDDAIDRERLVFNLVDLQRMLALGDGVHEIALRTTDSRDARSVAERVKGDPALAGQDVRSWDQLRPDLVAMIAVDDALMGLILGVVFVLAGLGVVSAMLMAVLERRREFGVLRAVGMEPGALVAMVACETLVLSVVAAAIGAAFGAAIDLYLAHRGLDIRFIGRFSLAGVGLDPVLHAAMTPRGIVSPIVAMVAVAALGSLFPAVLAARVPPAVGMREVA